MKKSYTLILALACMVQVNSQQLVTGNSDVVSLTGSPYFMQLVRSGPEDFYWVSGTYFSDADHPMLTDVVNDYQTIYFLKYNRDGEPMYANYIRGTYSPTNALPFAGGVTIVGIAYDDVVSNTGAVVPLNNASQVEFLANYGEKCQFEKIVPVWDLAQSQYVYSDSQIDPTDGSVYLAGVSSQPLNLFGYGTIGADLGHFLYVLKFDRSLSLVQVFTAGIDPNGEYGYYNSGLTLIADGKGGIIVTGTYEGDRKPVIGGDTLASAGFDTQGVFAFKLGPGFGVQWVREGKLGGFDYNYTSKVFKGFPMKNGDMVMAGATSTGYFSLGNVEVVFGNGVNYMNQFAFRIADNGEIRWVRSYQCMGEFYYGKKKGAASRAGIRQVQSDQFREYLDYDALQWNGDLLYMTGTYMSDSFEVAGHRLEKPYSNGIFVTATDLETGEDLWGYGVSADNVNINGFSADAVGNVSLMGSTGNPKYFEQTGIDSVAASQPVFVLGLSFEGIPLWSNDAFIPGPGYGSYGKDLLVLSDGEVFASLSKTLPDALEIGGVPIAGTQNYSAILVALDADNLLGGTLLTSDGLPVFAGNLKAYKMAASGAYPKVDSIPVAANGDYEFQGLYPGQYIIQAVPDKEAFPGAVPTYSGGAVAWMDAKLVKIDADTKFRSQYINLVNVPALTPEDGSGLMSGNVSYEEEGYAGKGTLGKPVTRTSVVLKRNASQQQKSTLEEDIVAYVETDDLGNYIFENVPDGDYILIVDIAGLPMIQTYNVVIVGNKIVQGLDFIVKQNGIETTGANPVEPVTRSALSVYPNPSTDVLHIGFPGNGPYSLRIYNAAGALMEARTFSAVHGPVILRISDWSRGVYLIDIRGPEGSEKVKFVKD